MRDSFYPHPGCGLRRSRSMTFICPAAPADLGARPRLRRGVLFILLAWLCLPFAACKMGNASDSWPRVLHYAYSPQMEELQGGPFHYEEMRKYLESQLHIPVELVQVQGYASTIEAMRAQKLDIALYGGLGYIIASQKAGAEAIVARGFPNGAMGGYRSVIAVPKDSPIHSMADLKAHAKTLVFDFADPASTSGYLYPRVGLQSMGINPDTDFKKVVFAGNHLAAAMTIVSGKVDAGAFMEPVMNRLVTLHKMSPGDVRILWRSDLIPNSCTAVRKNLPEKLKQQIQAALIALPQKDPALWANYMQTLHTPWSGSVNVAVTDASYNGLRSYAAQVKDFKFGEN
jgi:phosphonate transport system substrate-binding protein